MNTTPYEISMSAIFKPPPPYYPDEPLSRSVGTADLCSHFFLRANEVVRQNGIFGLLATDTISTGDTREVSLDQLVEKGCEIIRCVPKFPWPGNASVKVSVVHTCRGEWNGERFIDAEQVEEISAQLTSGAVYTPAKLAANGGKAFIGHYPMGKGFILAVEDANALQANNGPVLFPYLTGEDVNTSPTQQASRWAINFDRRTEEESAQFAECFALVKELVKPSRDKAKRKANRERWWQYAETRPGLCAALDESDEVFVQPFVSKYINPVLVDKNQVFASPMVVIAKEGRTIFPTMQSSLHNVFVRSVASNLGGTLRYAPTDCFEPYPFPLRTSEIESIGIEYHDLRQECMEGRQEGLTSIYNRFHDSDESSNDICRLRNLHVDMDHAVAVAYEWSDLNLDHDFYETEQGLRFTISESARREVLQRLLKTNHERYAEEEKQGLHKKKKSKGRKKKSSQKATTSGTSSKENALFDMGDS